MILILLFLPLLVLMSKSWYHWQYLRQVDSTLRPYASHHEYNQKMIDPQQTPIGGMGMNPAKRMFRASSLSMYTLLPVFSKYHSSEHSALALFYTKVIYWHLIAFYLTVGLLISFFVWG